MSGAIQLQYKRFDAIDTHCRSAWHLSRDLDAAETSDQLGEQLAHLEAGQCGAEAEVRAVPEGEMAWAWSGHIE